jgi:hypothetical protein
VAILETVPVGIRVEGVCSDGCLLYVEEPIAIHVRHRTHGIAALEGKDLPRFTGDARLHFAERFRGASGERLTPCVS